jgi:hypothetical protein
MIEKLPTNLIPHGEVYQEIIEAKINELVDVVNRLEERVHLLERQDALQGEINSNNQKLFKMLNPKQND